jgi:hypothetical protein
MATSYANGIEPDHIIIWLDRNMGETRNNIHSKKDLSNNAGLDCLPSDGRSLDIDNFIDSVDQSMNNEKINDLIKSPLRMFTDKNECIKCIFDNIQAKKQPFLITSGQMGAQIIPQIYDKLSGFIYVFCAQISSHTWAYDYLDHVHMNDDENVVFVRLLRDIGKYYIKKSEKVPLDIACSIQYLKWARRLVLRANKLDKDGGGQSLLKEINDKIALLELQENDNDDKMGQDADEG